ncbi:MAG: ATP-binding cassette domain-containing protein, partial [Betaproteobacteria bacterium]
MIEVEHLSKRLAGKNRKAAPVLAVADVSFTARNGRITALLGPNGAGKTTTLRIVTTL